jgi:hypothetical protein
MTFSASWPRNSPRSVPWWRRKCLPERRVPDYLGNPPGQRPSTHPPGLQLGQGVERARWSREQLRRRIPRRFSPEAKGKPVPLKSKLRPARTNSGRPRGSRKTATRRAGSRLSGSCERRLRNPRADTGAGCCEYGLWVGGHSVVMSLLPVAVFCPCLRHVQTSENQPYWSLIGS